jgi:hypothetical protein
MHFYGIWSILKHLEVDKIIWGGHFLKKNCFKRGANGLFGGKEGQGALLTGEENTAVYGFMQCIYFATCCINLLDHFSPHLH